MCGEGCVAIRSRKRVVALSHEKRHDLSAESHIFKRIVMPKAYWIARVTVTDPERYSLYATEATKVFATYNAKVLARGGDFNAVEGNARPRNVIIEFDSMEAALDCYRSPAYARARQHRKGAGVAEIVLVEGA